MAVTGEAIAEQLAAVEATRAEFETAWKKAMARAAFDLLLGVDPGSHEARRLHEMTQSAAAEFVAPVLGWESRRMI